MDRPTCRTCPYWEREERSIDGGECHRAAPVPMPSGIRKLDEWGEEREWGSFEPSAMFPATIGDDWCGEHPSFDAYLAGLKES